MDVIQNIHVIIIQNKGLFYYEIKVGLNYRSWLLSYMLFPITMHVVLFADLKQAAFCQPQSLQVFSL